MPISISAMQLILGLLGLGALYKGVLALLGGDRRLSDFRIGPDALIVFFLISVSVSIFFRPEVPGGVEVIDLTWKEALKPLAWIFYLYVISYLFSMRLFSSVHLNLFFGALFMSSAIGLAQVVLGYDFFRTSGYLHSYNGLGRAQGFFNNPMTFAHSLSVGLVFMLSVFVAGPRAGSLPFGLKWVVPIFLGAALLFSQTRGAWLAAGVGGFGLLWALGKRYFIAGAIGAAVSGGLLATVLPVLRERFYSIFDFGFLNNSTRIELWRANYDIFLGNPLFGVGPQRNVQFLPQIYQKLGIQSDFLSHAHNNFLEYLSTIGLFGTGSFYLIAGYFLFTALGVYRRIPIYLGFEKNLALGAFLGQMVFHVGGVTEANVLDTEVFTIVLVLWGMTVWLNREFPDQSGYA